VRAMVGDILQPTHLLFILVVALLVLGPKRLPEVGRTLGNGMRDFRAAINGESHDDHAPRAYVEPEPDPVPPHEADAPATEPAGFALAAEDSNEASAENEPAAATALHKHQLDPPAAIDDLPVPAAIDDLHPPAAIEDLPAPAAIDDLHPPAAIDDLPAADDLQPPAATADLQGAVATAAPDSSPAPATAASSSGFASALASSRQRPAADGEPSVDDE
jgi:sec-independent protein translocase protein TatA